MTDSDVYLRCSFLESVAQSIETSGIKRTGDPKEKNWASVLEYPVLAHWQIKCHGIVFEIHRDGAIINPLAKLRFCFSKAIEKDEGVFYEKRIGSTTLTAARIKDIGYESTKDGNYNVLFRNCQTTTKDLAEKIVTKANRDPKFKWPWRSSHAGMLIAGAVVAGVIVVQLAPLPMGSSVTHGAIKYELKTGLSSGWTYLRAGCQYMRGKAVSLEYTKLRCSELPNLFYIEGTTFLPTHLTLAHFRGYLNRIVLRTAKNIAIGLAAIWASINLAIIPESMCKEFDRFIRVLTSTTYTSLDRQVQKAFQELQDHMNTTARSLHTQL